MMQPDRPVFPSDALKFSGMSLRDWFAGQALGAVIRSLSAHLPDAATEENFADAAYRIADAMMEARK